jgi:hypothetical protein
MKELPPDEMTALAFKYRKRAVEAEQVCKVLTNILKEVPEALGEADDIHDCSGPSCLICEIYDALKQAEVK